MVFLLFCFEERKLYSIKEILVKLVNSENILDSLNNSKIASLGEKYEKTIIVNTKDGKKSNIPASEFIYDNSVCKCNKVNLRMLDTASGTLVGLGLLGTFLGLTLGIQGFDSSNTDKINESIQGLLNGMGTAFLTSLLGMFLSIVFTFIDKSLRHRLYKNVNGLTEKLDALYYIDDIALANLNQQNIIDRLYNALKSDFQVQTNTIKDSFNELSGKLSYTNESGVIIPVANAVREILSENAQQTKALKSFSTDLHVFDGIRYGQGNNRINPIEDYNIFNPTELNTDQWVQAAKAAGCKFAVLTATHETGFGLWQSDVNPYCLKAVKWRDGKGDIVRDFVNSCRKYGLQPGIYIGIRWNSLLGIHNFKAEGEGAFARNRQAWYKRLCEKMVTELCTRYGDLYMIWFDGGADDPRGDGPDVEPIVNKYQPNCLFYHNIDRADFRWGGSETGTVEYPCWSTFPVPCSHHKRIESSIDQLELLKHGDKNGKYWVPAMADTPLRGANGRHEWFWDPDDENNIYPLNTLMDKYEKSIGRNATLILGLTPDPTGLIPAGDAQRLKEMGDEISRRFSSPIARISGQKKSLTLKLGKEQPVNYCIIQENIKNGERIRQYQIEAKVKGKWQTVCKGESVGHKRIEKFEPVEATALRLTVSESVALPDIINFSAYSVK